MSVDTINPFLLAHTQAMDQLADSICHGIDKAVEMGLTPGQLHQLTDEVASITAKIVNHAVHKLDGQTPARTFHICATSTPETQTLSDILS